MDKADKGRAIDNCLLSSPLPIKERIQLELYFKLTCNVSRLVRLGITLGIRLEHIITFFLHLLVSISLYNH